MHAVSALLAAGLVLGLVGCSAPDEAPAADGREQADHHPAEAAWTASFTQDRPDQDSPFADVKVTNLGARPRAVTGVRLRWPGYSAGGWQPAQMPYAPDHTHRLDIRLTTPRCAVRPTDVPLAELRLADSGTVRVPIDRAGVEVLRRVWARMCGEQTLLRAVRVDFGDRWRRVRRPDGPALRGWVTARRGTAAGRVMLTETLGSVLLGFEPAEPYPLLLAASADRGRVPVDVFGSGRCDPHTLGQSTQTFTLRVWVSLDGGPDRSLVLVPDASVRRRLQAVIRDTCGLD